MDVAVLQKSLDLDTLAAWAGIRTAAGKEALAAKTADWTTDPTALRARSYEFAALQHSLQETPRLQQTLAAEFESLSALESDLLALCEPTSDLEQEAYKELLFLPDWARPLNFIPFLLVIWSICRVYVFPGMSLLMPIAMMILPFFLLRFLFGIPITTDRYFHMVNGLFTGNITAAFQPPNAAATAAATAAASSFLPSFDIGSITKMGILGITIVQSFLQPYWTFQHLSAIDSLLLKKANTLLAYNRLYESIQHRMTQAGYTLSPNPFRPDTEDPRQVVAYGHLYPNLLRMSLRRLGALEALVRLAAQPDMNPVSWLLSSTSAQLTLIGAYDYRVNDANRKTFTIRLGTSSHSGHALLTGPNRGGKSTTLRGVVASLLLAHTYGAAMASAAQLTPFHALRVCLTPEDLPGSKSRFEREIEFTASTLNEKGASLVLIDELYHSTNPPDAERACRIYTQELWRKPNTLSVISTHLFEFVKDAPSDVQRICCPATVDEQGVVYYSYQLSPGVCEVSSVSELLRENGLVTTLVTALVTALKPDSEISANGPESNVVPE
jgi:hypothetical protein